MKTTKIKKYHNVVRGLRGAITLARKNQMAIEHDIALGHPFQHRLKIGQERLHHLEQKFIHLTGDTYDGYINN